MTGRVPWYDGDEGSAGAIAFIDHAATKQARADRFEREAEKTLAEREATVAAIQRNTALAWLDRYYAEAMATVLAEQRRDARAEIEAAEGAYRAGRGNLADLLTARASLVGLDDRASAALDLARRGRLYLNAGDMLRIYARRKHESV